MNTYRVLVVDDYEPWRRYVRAALRKDPRWQIVGEASDGHEVIQKAATLRPDLILLDISLPKLDGIQAARRIRSLGAGCRILFVSEHQAADVVGTALATGAAGFLVKSAAGRELIPAMEAIVGGRRFMSAGLAALDTMQLANQRTSRRHEAGFYSTEGLLLDDYARFAGDALDAGDVCVVVTSDSRRHQIHERLRARGLDVGRAIEEGRFRILDVAGTLATFIVDGWPDDGRFLNVVSSMVRNASRVSPGRPRRVAACGDGAATLWTQGKPEAALRLERLWDEATHANDLEILCGYPFTLPCKDQPHLCQSLCAEHSTVYSR